MAYIGKQPLVGNYISCDSLSASATTTYNLVSSGTPVFPTVPQNCIVSLNGVVQAPVTSFTISGSAIVFSTTLSTTDSIDYITVLGNTLNIGTPSNNTVGLSQLSATGTPSATTFLRGDNAWATPAADLVWQSVQTTSFTAVAGRAYPVNTTSAGITVTLPATPAAGNQVQIVDYAGTADTNAIVINPNSNKIESGTLNLQLSGEREGVILTYIDATQGWLATSGINEGTDALSTVPVIADFLVIAGGGGGGNALGGGGGAGGYRELTSQTLAVATNYTVTVGGGGTAATSSAGATRGTSGSDSVFNTITSAGGGAGGCSQGVPVQAGISGGSGSGGSNSGAGGSGNTPTQSPSQGNNGGTGDSNSPNFGAGGGGGASAVGVNGNSTTGGNGGAGTASSITGSSVTRAGGGGGGSGGGTAGTGGTGGGGNATNSIATATAGTANTGGGGGGGGGSTPPFGSGGGGGSGVVIIKYSDIYTISNPGGGLTFTTATAGGFNVTTFTAGTGTIQFN
jgi:hypothetical protein